MIKLLGRAIVAAANNLLASDYIWDRAIAISMLTCVAILCTFSVYTIGSLPIWDGQIYNGIISKLIAGDLALAAIDTSELPPSQLGASYANRLLYFYFIAGIHTASGVELAFIYPAVNTLLATGTAYLLFVICRTILNLSLSTSLACGVWFLLNPAVLVINQVLAHPELLMTFFIAAACLAHGRKSYLTCAALIFLATLSKQTAVVAAAFLACEAAFRQGINATSLRTIATYMISAGSGLLIPQMLIDNTRFVFDLGVVVNSIIPNMNGQIFAKIAYNFGALWIPFFAGLAFLNGSARKAFIISVLIGFIASFTGSTDWFRTWFSLTFFFVLPTAAIAVERVTDAHGAGLLRNSLAFMLCALMIAPSPLLNMDRVNDIGTSTLAMALGCLLISYAINVMLSRSGGSKVK